MWKYFLVLRAELAMREGVAPHPGEALRASGQRCWLVLLSPGCPNVYSITEASHKCIPCFKWCIVNKWDLIKLMLFARERKP